MFVSASSNIDLRIKHQQWLVGGSFSVETRDNIENGELGSVDYKDILILIHMLYVIYYGIKNGQLEEKWVAVGRNPAILVDMGFLTSASDTLLLMSLSWAASSCRLIRPVPLTLKIEKTLFIFSSCFCLRRSFRSIASIIILNSWKLKKKKTLFYYNIDTQEKRQRNRKT